MRLFLTVLLGVVVVLIFVSIVVRLLAFGLPGTVTSWWRSWQHNIEVGGLSGSAHLIGWAVDLAPATSDLEDAMRRRYPVVVNEGDHLHGALFKA